MAQNSFSVRNSLDVKPQATAPSVNLTDGNLYYDSVRATFVQRINGNWADVQSRTDVATAATLTSANFTASVVQSSLIRLTGSTAAAITGFTAASAAKIFTLYNESSAGATLDNQSVSESTAANRIICPGGTNLSLGAGQSVQLGYDDSQARWIVLTTPAVGVTTPTASTIASRDANANLSANSFIPNYTTTVTSGSTITLTVGSSQLQYLTGTTAQLITLPVAATLVTGQSFSITNISTSIATVQSSGANTVSVITPGATVSFTCIVASGTSAASWFAQPVASNTFPGNYYAQAYYPSSATNYWSIGSSSQTDFTVNGTIPTPSTYVNSGFGTISKATSSLPGVSFTAPRTGTIEFDIAVAINTNNVVVYLTLFLLETTTTTTISTQVTNLPANQTGMSTIKGYFNVTASTVYNFKLQGQGNNTTQIFLDSSATAGAMQVWSMKYIN